MLTSLYDDALRRLHLRSDFFDNILANFDRCKAAQQCWQSRASDLRRTQRPRNATGRDGALRYTAGSAHHPIASPSQ